MIERKCQTLSDTVGDCTAASSRRYLTPLTIARRVKEALVQPIIKAIHVCQTEDEGQKTTTYRPSSVVHRQNADRTCDRLHLDSLCLCVFVSSWFAGEL